MKRERHVGDFVIGPGGCGSEGTWAYCLAVDELQQQLLDQGVQHLDGIVVAAGSGSTAAGLLAGNLRTRVADRIIAVQIAPNPALRSMILSQALYALWRHDRSPRLLEAFASLRIDKHFVGGGYGHASELGDQAAEVARSFGLWLEPTYTAKAFASTLSWAQGARPERDRCKLRLHQRRTYLYWHTLSSVPLTALLEGASETLPSELAILLPKRKP